jgi:flagellar basal body-associated protein FliL
MDESTRAVIIMILVILLLLAIAFLGTSFMTRRAVKAVIRMFRDAQAFTPQNAMTAEQIGFRSKSFLQFKAFRDYKPAALQFLMKNEIVQVTEDGRLFMSEEALYRSGIEQRVGK